MAHFSITTDIDLQNYRGRLDEIAAKMHPEGIEIVSLKQNYESRLNEMLPEHSYTEYPILNKELAMNLGREFRRHGIQRILFRYPRDQWALQSEGLKLATAFQFSQVIFEESDAQQVIVNYNNATLIPSGWSRFHEFSRKGILENQTVHNGLELRDQYGPNCLLTVENNPVVSSRIDSDDGKNMLYYMDLLPEDFLGRNWIDGITLDVANAAGAIEGFQTFSEFPNLEACVVQYRHVPQSTYSFDSYAHIAAPMIKWIRISDQSDVRRNLRLHLGEGRLTIESFIRSLDSCLKNDTVISIDVRDGNTKKGLKRIFEHDYPYLIGILNSISP
jgi:hypothetical protein